MNTTKFLAIRNLASVRRGFAASRIIYNKGSTADSSSSPASTYSPKLNNVKGLSDKIVHPASEPVGPGASKSSNYKNPEYFCYDRDSFFEAEVEMAAYRCPQPSNKKK